MVTTKEEEEIIDLFGVAGLNLSSQALGIIMQLNDPKEFTKAMVADVTAKRNTIAGEDVIRTLINNISTGGAK